MKKGIQHHRLASNPEEQRFATAWNEEQILKWILAPPVYGAQQTSVTPSERDEEVAATVIQWLGTPVGNAFLSSLGYFKRK